MAIERRTRRGILLVALVVATQAACGGDDDDTAATTTTAAEEAATNTLDVEMIDYAYKLKGALEPGLVTINSRNTGAEWHLAAFGKLKAGKTAADLTKALQEQAGPGGGGGEEDSDPTAEFIEKELGTPGHILQPGQSQSLTVDVFDPGTYVMLCFLPTEGEGGTPHLAKGMVASFEVAGDKAEVAEPEADATITLPDDAEPTGVPTSLESGRRTFKLTAAGSKGKDFAVGQLKDQQAADPKAFDAYFESEFEKEGGPAKGAATRAPGTLSGMTFELAAGQTAWITVDLKPGETFFINTTNTEDDEGEEGADKFVKVTVA